jgi:hypothetical protein
MLFFFPVVNAFRIWKIRFLLISGEKGHYYCMKRSLMDFKLKKRDVIKKLNEDNYEKLSAEHKKIITKNYEPKHGDIVELFMLKEGEKGFYLKKIIKGTINFVNNNKNTIGIFHQLIKGGDYVEMQVHLQPRMFFKLMMKVKKPIKRKKSSVGIHIGK